jgi:hypothetical protein
MSNGIVYFIQPGELIETDVYKVGYSSKLDLRRVLSYKKNTNYLSIIQCNNALKCEEEIKIKFKENFILHAGNEFFKGNKKDMLFMFNTIVNNHIKNCDEVIIKNNTDDTNHKDDNKNEHKIVNNEEKKVGVSRCGIGELKCVFCGKNYSNMSNRNKHEKICKIKKIKIENTERTIKIMELEKIINEKDKDVMFYKDLVGAIVKK